MMMPFLVVIQRVGKPEESPGKAPLFVPQVMGSLDFARDDGVFSCRHFDQVKRVEKSPKAKQYYPLQSTYLILSFRA